MRNVRLARVVVAFAQALVGQPLARSVGGGGDRAAPATARDDFDGAMVDRHGPRAFFLTSLKGEAVRRGQSPHEDIGRAHVCTPVTTAQLVCRLLLEKKKTTNK